MADTARRFQSLRVGKRSERPESHIVRGCRASNRWNTVEPQRPVPRMMIGFEILVICRRRRMIHALSPGVPTDSCTGYPEVAKSLTPLTIGSVPSGQRQSTTLLQAQGQSYPSSRLVGPAIRVSTEMSSPLSRVSQERSSRISLTALSRILFPMIWLSPARAPI